MSRISRSLIAQQVATKSELAQIALEQGWSDEEILLATEERFGTKTREINRFNTYTTNLIANGWEEQSIDFLKRNVENCASVLFSKNQIIPTDRHCGYGLVIGRIQSGKTAHMLGLAAKLLDNNLDGEWNRCHLVIILSGLIEDLRIQTLNRARDAKIPNVSIFPDIDFKPSDTTSKIELMDALTSESGIMIIKKNHEILEELNRFLMSNAVEDLLLDRRIVIIDDECDHASIDSGHAEAGESDEITRTNRAVRSIIQSCSISDQKCWYIGYTATPYSNLLMHTDPEYERSDIYGRPLFPRDFIYCIDEQPQGHFDNETLFYGDFDGAIWPTETPGVRSIEEDQLLEEFLLLHVVSRIIRSGQEEGIFQHTTMIHASRNVDDHMLVSDTISSKIDTMLARDYHELEHSAREVVGRFYQNFIQEYHANNAPIDDYSESRVKDELGLIEIIKLNSDNPQNIDALAYPSELIYPDNESKSFVVVGGQKLSRGLTLEGLVISWLARTSQDPKYDTMLQMARWCGFREPYEDLIRIFLPRETIEHYSHITEVEIRLRNDLYDSGAFSNPLEELHWIREYNGMLISGKIPDTVRRRQSGGGLVPSDYYSQNLAEDFIYNDCIRIQQNRLESFIDLELELGEKSLAQNGYDIFKGINSFTISDFLRVFASDYPIDSPQKTQLELLIEACESNSDAKWNVCVCQNRETRMGYRSNGRLHLRQGTQRFSLLDLDDGRRNREFPMLLVHSENPATENAGISVYSDNRINIIHIAVFLPQSMAPEVFYEVARPSEEE